MVVEVNAAIDELGEDADLLLQPDEWLESHRVYLQMQMSLLADQLASVLMAQDAKQRFRQARISYAGVLSIVKGRKPTP